MLWRVRQAFRRRHQATCTLTRRLTPTPLLSSSRTLCALPASATPQHQQPPPTNAAHPSQLSGRVELDMTESPPRIPRLSPLFDSPPQVVKAPSDMVSVLDTLFRLWSGGNLERDHLGDEYREVVSALKDRTASRRLAVSMSHTSNPRRACHVLLLAHYLGCKSKPSLYENVAHGLSLTRNWSLVVETVALGKQHTGRTTSRLLNWRTRALMELGQFCQVEHVPQEFKDANIPLNRMAYHLLISAHLRNRNLPRARHFLAEMEQSGIPANAATHAIIAAAYRSLGPDRDVSSTALASLSDLDSRGGTFVLNTLIRSSFDHGDIGAVSHYLSYFEYPIVDLGRQPYHGDAFIQRGDDPFSTGRTQLQHIIHPDIATFTILIDYFARVGDTARLAHVARLALKSGIALDDIFAEALVRAYISLGGFKAGLKLVASMCSNEPRTYPHFVQLGLDTLPADLPNEFTLEILPSVQVFNPLLLGALQTHGLAGAHLVTSIMAILNIAPNEAFVDTMISFLANADNAHPHQLSLALREMSKLVPLSLRHALAILSASVRNDCTLARKGLWYAVLARSWGNGQTQDGVSSSTDPEDDPASNSKPTDPVGGTPVSTTLFQPIAEELLARGIRTDKVSFAMRLRHDAVVKKNMAAAQETFQKMLDRGVHPNRYHFTALLEGYVRCGDMTSACGVMESAVSVEISPDIVMFTILLVGYAYQGKPTLAARTFQKMLSNGVTPDGKSISVLANAYAAVGSYSTARKVLLELWPYVGPRPQNLEGDSYKELMKKFQTATNCASQCNPARPYPKRGEAIRWQSFMRALRNALPRDQHRGSSHPT